MVMAEMTAAPMVVPAMAVALMAATTVIPVAGRPDRRRG